MSKYGNDIFGKFLWNGLLEPIGKKTTKADLNNDETPLICPDKVRERARNEMREQIFRRLLSSEHWVTADITTHSFKRHPCDPQFRVKNVFY